MDYPVIDTDATGRNLEHMIRNSGYSVSYVAEYLGATNSLVYRYMRGEVLPSTDRLLALSALLDVTINEILVVL